MRYLTTYWGGDLRQIGVDASELAPVAPERHASSPRNNFVGDPIHRVDLRLQRRFRWAAARRSTASSRSSTCSTMTNYGWYITNGESTRTTGSPAQNANVAYAPRMLQLGFRFSF